MAGDGVIVFMTLFQGFSSCRQSDVLLCCRGLAASPRGRRSARPSVPRPQGRSTRTRRLGAGRAGRVSVAGPGVRPRCRRVSTRGWPREGLRHTDGLPGSPGRAPSDHRTPHVPGVRATGVSAQNSERCPCRALNKDRARPRPPVASWPEPCHPCRRRPPPGLPPGPRCPPEHLGLRAAPRAPSCPSASAGAPHRPSAHPASPPPTSPLLLYVSCLYCAF